MTATATGTHTTSELIDAARRGDERAYSELVRRHERYVWSVVRRYRLSHADSQDVVQITWLRLLENLDRIRDPERLASWLITTAGRECLRLARGRTPVTADATEQLDRRPDDQASPEQQVIQRVMAGVLRKHVATLPARAQTLLWTLARHDAPGYRELARLLDMPVGSIGPTRGRCLRRLRLELEQVGLPRSAWY